jgi:FlaA1/EpsC-like NDP-sugar epimerase
MRNRYILLADIVLIAVAASAAFTARFDWTFYQSREEFLPYLLAALAIKPIVFLFSGMYRRYWQYTSIHDLAVVFTAVSASSLLMGVFVAIGVLRWFDEFSRVVILNDWLMTLAVTGGLRVAVRILSETNVRPRGGGQERRSSRQFVLIAGAGQAGTMVAREMRRNPQLGMEPIGFVDDDEAKIRKQMGGLEVLGSVRQLPQIVGSRKVDMVLIAMPTAPGSTIRAVVDMCRLAGVRSQTVPGVFELLDGRVDVSRLRKIEIADLLRRSPVKGDVATADFVAGKVVLITGAGGSIGSELARQLANAAPARLVLLGHGENSIFDAEAQIRAAFPGLRVGTTIADVRDEARLARVFDQVRPSIVFHAAAHKHVPLMEANPEEAITNNVIGTRNVVNEAVRAGTERFVLISTDKAVAPNSIMGASKRVAEAIVRQAARRSGRAFVSVRFGNVLGSRGSVVNTFKQQIEAGGPITVTDPQMTRFFMTIPEAVHLVLQASGKGRGGELFVLDMGEPVRIVDLAKDLIKLSGLGENDVPIVFTGARPGEKLHEALFDPGMQTKATSHPEVLEVVGPDGASESNLDRIVDDLWHAATGGDRVAIDALLAEVVPGFTPATRPWDVRI